MEFNLNDFKTGNGQKKKGGSILGALILLVIGTILLWWNEYNNVQNIVALSEYQKEAIEISSETVDPQYDGKAVALNGPMTVVDDPLQDNEFAVAVKTARLKRIVEMYQWEEDKDTDDNGRTTYSYRKKWSETVLGKENGNDTTHNNPTSMPFKSNEFLAQDVKVGAYNLSDKQIAVIATDTDYDFPAEAVIDGYLKKGTYLTNSLNLDNPEIGDIRIYWKYNNWKEASVAATISGKTFKDYSTKKSANTINRVDEGLLTKDELVRNQENENDMIKWILRGVGALLILFGYLSLISFITRFTNKIPILGSVVGWALTAIAFLIAVIHSLAIIIIAWFRYRPVLAIILLVVVIAAVVGIVMLVKKKKANNNVQ